MHVLEYKTYVDKKEKSSTARIRDVVWFNPPWDSRVKTNVGRIVLESFKRHIPAGHELYHIFNKNTIKVSYSCLPNIKVIIAGHNQKIVNKVEIRNKIKNVTVIA